MRQAVVATAMGLMMAACAHNPITQAQPIRVLVLSMHGGKDAADKPNLDAIKSLVIAQGADLLLLQDVDQVSALGQSLNYASASTPAGPHAVATLAKGFIGFTSTIPLPVPGSPEPSGRVALAVLASLRTGQFAALNTYLDAVTGTPQQDRIARLKDAIELQKAAGTPFVVGGSFNATPDNPAFAPFKSAGLRDAWTECGSGDGFTSPADNPTKRTDYLFLANDLHCSAAKVLDTQISDHRALLVTLK